LNQGGWSGHYNIAPEPCSAGMDRIDMSKMWGMGSHIRPYATIEWYLDISIDKLGNEDGETVTIPE